MKNQRSNSARIVRQTRSILSNVLFFGCIGCGTMASAALPFYIHFHPEKFGPPLMHFSGDLERNLVAEDSVDMRREQRISALVRPKLQLDKITTGSIKDGPSGRMLATVADQPFPGGKIGSPLTLEILFVSSNRALIVDGGKVETVRVGSKLSNGAAVEAITQSKGLWSIKISTGAAYNWAQRD